MAIEWKPDAELESMMASAERDGLWFYSEYQGDWFSPEELRSQWTKGYFCYGAISWQLRAPEEAVVRLKNRVEQAKADLEKFLERLAGRAEGK